MTVEPAVAAGQDIDAVPGYIWTAMLILDAAGPICSYAGLGAATFLVGAGGGGRIGGQVNLRAAIAGTILCAAQGCTARQRDATGG